MRRDGRRERKEEGTEAGVVMQSTYGMTAKKCGLGDLLLARVHPDRMD